MGKPIAVASAVAAMLTLIDNATISRKLCNSLMMVMVFLRAAVVVAARLGVGCADGEYEGSNGEIDKLLHGGDLAMDPTYLESQDTTPAGPGRIVNL
jgi:hypothetical protein